MSVAARFRKIVYFVHLLIGIVLGLYFSLLGLTGALLVFKSDLHKLAFPALHYVAVPAGAQRQSLDQIVGTFKAAHQRDNFTILNLPLSANEAVVVFYKAAEVNSKKKVTRQTFIDPYTCKILGEQIYFGEFFYTVHDLHVRLLLEDKGRAINRIGVLCIVALLSSGLIIWFPPIARFWQQFKQKTRVKLDGSAKRIAFDIHNMVGFYAGGILLVLAVTAISELWHTETVAVVAALTGQPTWNDKRPQPVKTRISYDTILANAKAALPKMDAYSITDSLRVKMIIPGEQPVSARFINVVIDPESGLVSGIEDPSRLPSSKQIMAWLLPVHFGQWGPSNSSFGWYAVKTVWVIVGLCPTILFVTGAMIWWERRKKLLIRASAGSIDSSAGVGLEDLLESRKS